MRSSSKRSPFQKQIGLAAKYIIRGVLIGVAISNLLTPPDIEFARQENRESLKMNPSPELDDANTQQKELTFLPPRRSKDWSCTWFPNDHKQCDELFFNRLPHAEKIEGDNEQSPNRSQRWLFFGDSTMKRLFDRSDLKTLLVQDPLAKARDGCLGQGLSCEEREADQCELNSNFDLAYADEWVSPDPSLFEGPKKKNAYCTDCSGCQTHFLDCRSMETPVSGGTIRALAELTSLQCEENQGRYYGGYMTMEFARDTEIQTPEFRTTQENIAAYIMRNWNSPDMLKHWKKPICVLGAGNHDILIDGITTEDFVRNVKFMLTTMKPACEHMIWLGNTTNGKESEYLQTMKQMKIFDRGVKEMLESEPELLGMMSFLDVIDASLTFPHADYIHMDDNWYSQLGKWFITLM